VIGAGAAPPLLDVADPVVEIVDQLEAVEHGLLASNPARGRRRRLKADRPTRRFLEADEVAELLAVAGELDRSARSDQRIGRRPLIAVMAKSGLRVGEVCALRWRRCRNGSPARKSTLRSTDCSTARTATSSQPASKHRTESRRKRGTLATLTAMFTGPRRPCWATLWATEAAHPRQGNINQDTCESIWARLGSNQRPLACEASALPLSYAPRRRRFYADRVCRSSLRDLGGARGVGPARGSTADAGPRRAERS
jgi:hypothetical protein